MNQIMEFFKVGFVVLVFFTSLFHCKTFINWIIMNNEKHSVYIPDDYKNQFTPVTFGLFSIILSFVVWIAFYVFLIIITYLITKKLASPSWVGFIMFSTLFNGYVIDYFIPKSRQIVKHSKFMSLASYILVPLFIGIAIFELL